MLVTKSPTAACLPWCNGFRRYPPTSRALPMNQVRLQLWYSPTYLLHTQTYATERYLLLTVLFPLHVAGQEHSMVVIFVVIQDSKTPIAIPEVCSPHHQHMHMTLIGPFLCMLCVLEKWLGTTLGYYCNRSQALDTQMRSSS